MSPGLVTACGELGGCPSREMSPGECGRVCIEVASALSTAATAAEAAAPVFTPRLLVCVGEFRRLKVNGRFCWLDLTGELKSKCGLPGISCNGVGREADRLGPVRGGS